MALISPGFPPLSLDIVSLYHTRDPLLDNFPFLIFYGPSTVDNATQRSSRIQAHVCSLAGFRSFPRLTIAPSSPMYAAVNHLPAELQGDEVYRGLAVGLLTYFAALTQATKDVLKVLVERRRADHRAPAMFDEMHAGDLVARMVKVDANEATLKYLTATFSPQRLSWTDVDFILPPGTVERTMMQEGVQQTPALGDDGLPLFRYGSYSAIIDNFGCSTFLPTSKLKRAPSRPTAHSKTRSLQKEQKIALRREMCELLDTERRYVDKMDELVNVVALSFRQHPIQGVQGTVLQTATVDQLFPASLSQILELNAEFYQELEDVLSKTEDEAINDIDEVAISDWVKVDATSRRRDPTGTLTFAKVLLKWFPRFLSPYQDYLRTSTDLPRVLIEARSDSNPGVTTNLNEIGEQKLRSMLIEPVQRLPRYSLLLDNMMNQLPALHPAMCSLLKARDIIADICALDQDSSTTSTRASSSLRKLIGNWPTWLSPPGRLITAVDALELDPPYEVSSSARQVILLLFPNILIVIRRKNINATSARGILAETDHPNMASSNSSDEKNLLFSDAFDISKVRLSESADGRLIRIMNVTGPVSQNPQTNPANLESQIKSFALLGSYEYKAIRLSEEIAKARIEGRFSEAIRESDKWAVRRVEPSGGSMGLVAALFEAESTNDNTAVMASSRVRVYIGGDVGLKTALAQNSNVEIAANVTPLDSRSFRLDVEGIDGSHRTDTSDNEGLAQVLIANCRFFTKSILGKSMLTFLVVMHLLQSQADPRTLTSAALQICCNRVGLRYLPSQKQPQLSQNRSLRPLSPVKLVSNFFGSSSNQFNTPSRHQEAPKVNSLPPLPPPKLKADDLGDSLGSTLGDKAGLVGAKLVGEQESFAALEATFAAYLIALRSRSGNIVSRVLRNRGAADELLVNELYNTLIEDASRIQCAAEASVDVLFAAFEKFLTRAWPEKLGHILAPGIPETLLSSLDSGRPGEFPKSFKIVLEDMTPQNRRCFISVVKLLSDLVEASGNDGDRGALIASFTEALVRESNPHDYITLFDRLVDDSDTLFDDSMAPGVDDVSNNASTSSSLKRNRSVNTGSLSSNASSLRRRFGFGTLTRENSKSEPESKMASVWRTLSKNARSAGDYQQEPASISKASLTRSRSTDSDTRMLPPIRPTSRDRPTPPSASPRDGPNSRPTSSHLNLSVLSTIGEGTPTKPTVLIKKKRRSSLSDLKSVHSSPIAPPWLPLQPRKAQRASPTMESPPKTPINKNSSAPTPGNGNYSARLGPPEEFGSLRGSPKRFGSPGNKENSPLQGQFPSRKEGSPSVPRFGLRNTLATANTTNVIVRTPNSSPRKRTPSYSGIPILKEGLAERARPPNGLTTPSPRKAVQPPPQKLRMQNPHKLRQRLSNEQAALSNAETSLQADIAKIGEEMAAFKLSRPDTRFHKSGPTAPADTAKLAASVAALETRLATLVADLSSRNHSLSKDVELCLLHERKVRMLDELYREANAENEALYDRFNDELDKVLRGVRGGQGPEEMGRKMKEAQEEVGRLRRENARLRREVVGLKSVVVGS